MSLSAQASLPCQMPECERPLGHLAACTSSACPGCITLCDRHVTWLLEDVASLPTLLDDLAQVLASIDGHGITLREPVVDARSAIVGSLSEIVSALQEEHNLPAIRAEAGEPLLRVMASWIEHHLEYVAYDEHAAVMAQTIRRRVQEAHRLAYAVRHRGVLLGRCPLVTRVEEGTENAGTENPDQDENDSHHPCGGAVVFETCAPGKKPESSTRCTRCGARLPIDDWQEAGLETKGGQATEQETLIAVTMITGEQVSSALLRKWRQQKAIAGRMAWQGSSRVMVYEIETVLARVREKQQARMVHAIRTAAMLPKEQRYSALVKALPDPGPFMAALMHIVISSERGKATSDQVLALLEKADQPEDSERHPVIEEQAA